MKFCPFSLKTGARRWALLEPGPQKVLSGWVGGNCEAFKFKMGLCARTQKMSFGTHTAVLSPGAAQQLSPAGAGPTAPACGRPALGRGPGRSGDGAHGQRGLRAVRGPR